jgi:glutamate racemase
MAFMSLSPIGIFDSGLGGLTVYKALREAFPHEDFVYLADTARLPYGEKSAGEVAEYTMQAAQFLRQHNIKMFVIACNAASSAGLPVLREEFPDFPILGVIEPTIQSAITSTHTGTVALIATARTVQSGAYEKQILGRRPDIKIHSLACPELVTLVESGDWNSSEAENIIRSSIEHLGKAGVDYDSLILGCTHFPFLTPLLRRILGSEIPIIDGADAMVGDVRRRLKLFDMVNDNNHQGQTEFFVTHDPEQFGLTASRFLSETIVLGGNLSTCVLDVSDTETAEIVAM